MGRIPTRSGEGHPHAEFMSFLCCKYLLLANCSYFWSGEEAFISLYPVLIAATFWRGHRAALIHMDQVKSWWENCPESYYM